MKYLKRIILAAIFFATPCLHAALPVVGIYAEGAENEVDFTMGYSGNTTWTAGIGQELGASQILTLEEFSSQVATAFAEGRGGVINFDNGSLNDNQSFTATFADGAKSIDFVNQPGHGGTYSISGPSGDRTGVSGDQFLTRGGNPHFDLVMTNEQGFEPDERVTAVGVTILGRDGQGTGRNFRVIAFYTNGLDSGSSSTFRSFDMENGNGTQDSFSGIVAPEGYWITRVRVHSDHGVFVGIDDLAFMTQTVSSLFDFEVPYAITFGEGAGRQGDTGLLVANPESFVVDVSSLTFRPASASFGSAAALTHVVNHREREDFSLNTAVMLKEAPQGTDHRVGLAVLGGPDEASFDVERNDGFYGLTWTPGDAGSSVMEIREGFDGAVLASAPWPGGEPEAAELTTVFFEDFEGDVDGWTSGGAGNNWEIGEPVDGYGPAAAFSGENVAATGLDEKYGFNVNAWFRSPVIDLSNALAAELRFQEFTELEDFGVDGEFHFTRVAILDATNSELVELARYNDQTGTWRERVFELPSSVLGGEVVVEFRLSSDDIDGDVYDGWFIDDVEVLAANAPVYRMLADGFYLPDGSLNLSFTMVDEAEVWQTVSATIADPLGGTLFGVGGRSRIENDATPAFGFMNLSMDVEPFNFTFGSELGRDSGERLVKNVAEDWTVTPDALRLEPTAEEYYNSLAVNHIPYFEGTDYRMLELHMSLESLDSVESENRVGMVLFGDDDASVFDAGGDSGYYTFQWMPNTAAGGMVAVREGMNGAIVAGVDFADLKNPPEVTEGGDYTFTFLTRYPEAGGMNFWAVLTDEFGGEAAVSGTLTEAPAGTRFGFGARHRSQENPVWDFREMNWLTELPTPMPLDYRFGNAGGRDAPNDFMIDSAAPGAWSLQDTSWRVNINDAATQAGEVRSAANVNAFYTPGQDFAARSLVSTRLLPEDGTVLGLRSGGDPENEIVVGTNGATPESGTVAVSFNLRGETGGTIFGHVSPRNNFSNRIYITYQNPEQGITVRLGSSSDSEVGFVPELGTWYHMALAWDSGEYWVYLDGQQIASGEYGGLNEISDAFEIGNIGHLTRNEYAPNGFFRDASAWNIALTETDVQDALEGLTGNETGLVGYWPLNEGEGTTVADLSPNGNDGVITGGQWIQTAPRFGVSFLGREADADSAYTFEWFPVSQELRMVPPADVTDGAGAATLDLSGVAGAPGFAAGDSYLLEVRGIHQPDGSLELVGLLMDGDEGEAELSVNIPNMAASPQGSRFGITGRHVSIDWHTFQMGTPDQIDSLDPTDPIGPTFDAWLTQNFTAEELGQPEISGPLATPAGDGLANLLKYAFGLEPKVAVGSLDPRLPQSRIVDGVLELTYLELRDAQDLEYIPEMSETLEAWNPEGVVEANRVQAGVYDEVTVQAVLPDGAPRGFLRVRVVAAE